MYSLPFSFMDWVKRLILASVFASLVFTSVAQVLPQDELEALRAISSSLGIAYWNISNSACNSDTGFNRTIEENNPEDIYSHVACNCSFNSSTVCHVTNIELKGLNLTGNLPDEFVNLTYLTQLDLSRNFINGSIPRAFGQLRVTQLSLIGNNLTGPIPEEIGDITTLEELVLEDNMLEGNLPAGLGTLSNLRRLLLSANNFNGTIPPTFGNLRNLTDFRIDGTTISGRIPDFIGNWTRLIRLDMQGTSLSGPIPDAISLLTNLTDLRISDLNASNIAFPNLRDMTRLRVLILRNCSIADSIPPYITGLSRLDNIDLSFNRLNGEIPSNITSLSDLSYLFLSNNSLTGEIPGTLLETRQNIWRDLSYNNFTGTTATSCQFPSSNLFASHSAAAAASNSISWCLQPNLPCDSDSRYHSVFVNCGGDRTEFEGDSYEADLSNDGPAHYEYHNKWAYSTTGTYMGNDGGPYRAGNDSTMNSDGAIYQTARLSPHSIRYYGRCLRSGSYRVRLYFAEIIFYDNATYNSLGRRLFDIAIQGEVLATDFDITKEANGVRRGIFREYNVNVTGTTLEIHLYWRGKGTTAIPTRGYYGPLISAIAVTPNFKVDTGGLSVGAIVGIAIASSVIVLVLLILVILWKKGYLGGKEAEDKELRALDLQTGFFTLRQIKAATGNFDSANKIGEGGFGPVYKGTLSDGTIIAVKQLSSKSKQGNREFVNEIGMISALQHPNLVRLYGCCIEGNQLLLIYEYLVNNSLARALFGREDQRLNLDWGTRKKICIGIARGLAYLHEESRLKIVHRDIKATNVLLDKDLNAKISDFGLAKLDEEENTHISTRIAGTIGYMAPEYAMRGYLTDKADVYSFGIVLLEVVSGKSNTNYRPKEEFVYLLDWAYVLQEQGSLLELVDPILGSDYSKKEAMRTLNLALLCANPSPTLRPSMSAAVSMLEGNIPVQAPIVKRDATGQDARFKAFELLSQDTQTYVSSVGHESRDHRGASMDGPWIDSSVTISSNEDSRDHTSTRNLLPEA